MTKTDEFFQYVKDLFAEIDGITYRRMFGGCGIYKNGLTFAIMFKGSLYFRVDELNRGNYERLGSQPFVYETKTGPRVLKSHLELPSVILEDPDELPIWVETSYQAARKAKSEKG